MPVGVPRSLGFFYLHPLYRTFLAELGVRWEESSYTSESDLARLDLCPTDEPCVAVKAAFVHVDNLLRKGCRKIFIPAVVSLSETSYCCPKMMGLPSMIKAAFGLSDEDLISPVIDMRDNPKGWQGTWIRAARKMGVSSQARASRALREAVRALRAYEEGAVRSRESFWDTAVMGHSYILDDIFGRGLLERVSEYGPVVTAENVSKEDAAAALHGIFEGERLWTIEGRILGATLHLIRSGKVGRLIFVSAFSCGPASIIENYVAKEAGERGIPLLSLTVDEHSGEAGLLTRIEAFMDSTRTPARRVSRAVVPAGARADRRGCGSGTPDKERCAVPGPGGAGGDPHGRTLAFPDREPFASAIRDEGPIGLVDMGHLRYALRALFAEMGSEVAMPPPLTEDIVRLGKEIAPEFICYPMVTLIGQMRKHAEDGIRKIVMIQGKGRCRLGWYAQVMEEILRKNGYPVRVVSVDSPLPLSEKWERFVESYRDLSGDAHFVRGLRGVRIGLAKIAACDRAVDLLREVRAYEAERGEGDQRFDRFLRELDEARNRAEVKAVFAGYRRDMKRIPRLRVDPLRIAIVGEVYVVNEPFVNKSAEKILGSLQQRVRVYRTLDVTSWLDYHVFKRPRAVIQYGRVVSCAAPYLPLSVGGHGQESVGEAVLAKRLGMDGVIHVFPFTCMPEIIAQNILVRVSKDLDIPVLSLMISEQTGVAGLETRFEAFCDLLEGRRKRSL